ncbi:hypothetical protein WAI453_010356 [Rhynchosporium graminicola]|uniref:Uncharacterized protein n=1 Tax=Rhynchosporium graminicola TaxID=2792576 RepID=A0A1E1JTQ5_9HELO|nr:uncharacterized protein RCO7_04725 [Rhynchosporium commune]
MRRNTNRRHKRKELSAKVVKRDVSQLTSPSVVQQALQTKRFQLLPRALQDLEDKSKMQPVPGNLKRLGSHVGGGKGFESASSRGGQDDSIGKLSVELGLLDESSTIQYHLYYPGLASSILDPLMAYLPLHTPYRTRLLIQHNFTAQSRCTSHMISVRKPWFALSLIDLAIFNVVLSHYAETYRLLTSQGDLMESFSFTAASIKIANERLHLPA